MGRFDKLKKTMGSDISDDEAQQIADKVQDTNDSQSKLPEKNDYQMTAEKLAQIQAQRQALEGQGVMAGMQNAGLGLQEVGQQIKQRFQNPNAPVLDPMIDQKNIVNRMQLDLAQQGPNLSPEERTKRELAIAAAARRANGITGP